MRILKACAMEALLPSLSKYKNIKKSQKEERKSKKEERREESIHDEDTFEWLILQLSLY